MTKNKNTESKVFPIDARSIRSLNKKLDSNNSFYVNKSYKRDSSFVVDWQLPEKTADTPTS